MDVGSKGCWRDEHLTTENSGQISTPVILTKRFENDMSHHLATPGNATRSVKVRLYNPNPKPDLDVTQNVWRVLSNRIHTDAIISAYPSDLGLL